MCLFMIHFLSLQQRNFQPQTTYFLRERWMDKFNWKKKLIYRVHQQKLVGETKVLKSAFKTMINKYMYCRSKFWCFFLGKMEGRGWYQIKSITRNHEWEVQGLLHKVRKCRKINTEIEQKNNNIAACSKFKWALFYAYTNCHF